MAAIEALPTLVLATRVVLDVSDLIARTTFRGFHLFKLYGPSGIPLLFFGNRTTWRIEAQILGQLEEKDAMAFKSSVLDECTMIAVAAAIVAQIAITGLSLDNLSQTHWVARGAFVLSLTSSLMAVYYATTQQRMLGRLLQAKQVRLWIRGGSRVVNTSRIVPSLDEIVQKLRIRSGRLPLAEEESRAERRTRLEVRLATRLQGHQHRIEEARPQEQMDSTSHSPHFNFANFYQRGARFVLYYVAGIPFEFRPSDPDDFKPNRWDRMNLKRAIIKQCLTPSASSVITISAPQMLLSTSLCSLLIGFGVYFGFIWTRSLDPNAGLHDSRNVFITYMTGLIVSSLVYSISQLFQDDDKRTEGAIMEDYLKEYVENNPETVIKWGVEAEIVDEILRFHSTEAESSRRATSEMEQNSEGDEHLDSTGIELENVPALAGGQITSQ